MTTRLRKQGVFGSNLFFVGIFAALFSSLVGTGSAFGYWVLQGQSDFVGLRLIVNSSQVVIIPVLVVGLWIITGRAKYIGREHGNRWWENLCIGFLCLLGCVSTVLALSRFAQGFSGFK